MSMKFENALDAFHHLFTLDEHNMLANLNNVIGTDDPIYEDVMKLINAHNASARDKIIDDIVSKQASELVDNDKVLHLQGKQVGVYQLTKLIGRGGMGAVYLGERNDGQLEQKVAIKFVFPALATVAGDDFLLKEAQYLADLEHPNITKILTVGRTEENLPYMVMEFIDGQPIHHYCDENELTLAQRIELFQKVCFAVQYAHQHMIVHADIKPSNILVDKQGEPKLMDFGIAQNVSRAIDSGELDEQYQQHYLQALSRDFASPEQLEGKLISTVSDVYSLGKLFKALAICHGDLKLIQTKCCQQDSAKRYASVSLINKDINNWRQHYPLLADNPTSFKIVSKYLRRNRLVVGFFSIVLLSTLGFSAKIYEQNKTLKETIEKEAIIGKFTQSILRYGNRKRVKFEGELLFNDVLNDLSERAVEELAEYPFARYAMLLEISKAYQGQSKYKEGLEVLLKVPDIEDILKDDFVAINYYVQTAYLLNGSGEIGKAIEAISQATMMADDITHPTRDEREAIGVALLGKSFFEYKSGRFEEAIKSAKEGAQNYHDVLPINHYASAYNTIGTSYRRLGNTDKAIEYLTKSIDVLAKNFGSRNHPSTFTKQYNLIKTHLLAKKDVEQSLERLVRLRENVVKTYNEDHRLIKLIDKLSGEYASITNKKPEQS